VTSINVKLKYTSHLITESYSFDRFLTIVLGPSAKKCRSYLLPFNGSFRN